MQRLNRLVGTALIAQSVGLIKFPMSILTAVKCEVDVSSFFAISTKED
jgi:hypothetical protein